MYIHTSFSYNLPTDFNADRLNAIEKNEAALDLVSSVKQFAKPGEDFRTQVSAADSRRSKLDSNLSDLKDKSEMAKAEIGFAATLNFKNDKSPAEYKRDRIRSMTQRTSDNNILGKKLESEAKSFLEDAVNAFDLLNEESQTIQETISAKEAQLDADGIMINNNVDAVLEAAQHANDLEMQAEQLRTILDDTKSPAERTLEAASAYDNIGNDINESQQRAAKALEMSNEVALMALQDMTTNSIGLKDKADQSATRTQELNDAAQKARQELHNDLDPQLGRSKQKMDKIAMQNKATKQSVEVIISNLRRMADQEEELKLTVKEADDAETLAHDALASIDARADEIKRNMGETQDLQNRHAEMTFAMGATEKALAEIQERRKKRETESEDFKLRLSRLLSRGDEIDKIRESNAKMLATLRKRVKSVRKTLSGLKEIGVTFKQGSSLELQTPPRLTELSSCTQVSFYFTVSKTEEEEGKAFLFYLGNEVGTHMKMPATSTDDYMALEVNREGNVKLTIDLGTGVPFEVISNAPIKYGEWHQLLVDRRGHYVTLTVRSEAGVGEITEDKVADVPLPRIDGLGRPVGAVFNLHPDYSRVFVGGFPLGGENKPRIQDSVRETDMDGQIDGLEIGGEPIGLWNYRAAMGIKGARPRNKFKQRPETSVKFGGLGYIAIPDVKNKYFANVAEEYVINLKFKTANGNGILMLMGDAEDLDFVCVELINQVIIYSFNLGDATVQMESTNQTALNEWQNVEIRRNGRQGSLSVNGQLVGEMVSGGQMDRLSVEGSLYIGGYPGDPPYVGVSSKNFSGCIEELYLDSDPITLSSGLEENSVGVRPGCMAEAITLATFPASSPGYIQLNGLDLDDHIEISFMFRTPQERALLLYMTDSPNRFYYVSLSLVTGGRLQLNVFPRNELITGSNGKVAVSYNDNKWHVVTILISQTGIQMLVDDYENEKLETVNQMLMTERYNVFLGGHPQDFPLPNDAAGSDASFIGCIRDVLIEKEVTDLNGGILYSTPGIELGGVCKTPDDVEDEDELDTGEVDVDVPVDGADGTIEDPMPGPDPTDNAIPDETTGVRDSWDNFGSTEPPPAPILPPTYKGCKIPLTPAIDPDIRKTSGLRFGTKEETFLEFNRLLKVKKRSEFSIEFRTSSKDGIIFYVANKRNVDFISLYMKNGRVRKRM